MVDRSRVEFGRALKREWLLDEGITYLNHGTVGATPRHVLAVQRRIQDEIESRPAQFLLRDLSAIRVGAHISTPGRLRVAAAEVARRLGSRPDDLVFVDNATAGANAVLRSCPLGPGDEIAVLDLAYGGILRAARFAARERGARVVEIVTKAPDTPDRVVEDVAAQLTGRTRLLVVDHVAAESALVLPVAGIAALCRERGVLSLVDGAHAPGALALDIESIGADFYTANLHKWAWAPRSCGVLWARPEHQAWLHPPVVSWGLDQGFTTEFDWVGTRDPSPFLAAPAAFDLLETYGCARVRSHNHDLAWRGAHRLAGAWGVTFDTPEAMIGTMATVQLPPGAGATPDDAARLRDALLFEDRIEVQLHSWRGRLSVRISAQIYNDMADVDRLASAVTRRLAQEAPSR
jgi:isopenicillin-N epimerase